MAAALRNLMTNCRAWWLPIVDPLAYVQRLAPQPSEPGNAEALLRGLELRFHQKLRQLPPGDRQSLLRGQGLDFADLREYFPGDDIRKIDWNVFARTLTPHIREYHEEKQVTLWFYVDLTPSMFFGQTKTKARQAIELVGLIGLLVRQSGYKLGAYLVSAERQEIIEPRGGQAHLQVIVQRLLEMAGAVQGQVVEVPPDFEALQLEKLRHLVQRHKQATVFVLSDYLSRGSGWQKPLGELARQAALFHLLLADPMELSPLADLDVHSFFDPETGRAQRLDTGDEAALVAYRTAVAAKFASLEGMLSKTGRVERVLTSEEPVASLLRVLRQPLERVG